MPETWTIIMMIRSHIPQSACPLVLSHRKRLDVAERPSVGTASSVFQYDRLLATCQYFFWILFPLAVFSFHTSAATAGGKKGYGNPTFPPGSPVTRTAGGLWTENSSMLAANVI